MGVITARRSLLWHSGRHSGTNAAIEARLVLLGHGRVIAAQELPLRHRSHNYGTDDVVMAQRVLLRHEGCN